MPDRVRIVDLPDDGRAPIVVKNIADDVSFLTDGFTLGSPNSKPVMASPGGRWGGSRVVAETHENVTHTWRVRVIGTSTNDCINKIESLLQTIDVVWRGRYIEYRPEEATYSTYFELRGPMSWTPQYVYAELAGAATMMIELQASCAPLSLGDRMDIWDDFAPRGNVLYTNLVYEPSFELSALFNGWGNDNGTIAQSSFTTTGFPLSGTYSLAATRTNAGSGPMDAYRSAPTVYPYYAVTAGKTYTAAVTSVSQGTSRQVSVQIQWQNTSNATISSDTGAAVLENPLARPTVTAVAPAGAVSCRIIVNWANVAQNETHNIDGLVLVEGSVSPPYFDGDTNRGEWTGTAHASTSRLYDAGPLDDWTNVNNTAAVPRAASGSLNLASAGEMWMTHTARGYQFADAQATIKTTIGLADGNSFTRLMLRYQSTTQFLWAGVYHNGTWGLVIYKQDNGDSQLAITTGLPALTAGQTIWLRFRIEGTILTAEFWLSEPLPGATPSNTLTYTLTAAEAAQFRTGISGVRLGATTGDVAVRWDDYKVEPYTYASRNLPDVFDLTSIPGDAPSLCDIWTDLGPTGTTTFFAAFGWESKPAPFNMIWNGDFEHPNSSPPGWSVAAVTNINTAATSIIRQNSQAKYGSASGEITTISTNGDSGTSYRIFRRFRKGVTYTATMWVRSSTSTAAVRIKFGNAAASDVVNSGSLGTPLSTTWQQISVTWTPTADRDDAHIGAMRIFTGANDVFQIDGVQVYEGTTAPSVYSQTEGRGALPPIGILEAEDAYQILTNFTITADANARGGFVQRRAIATPSATSPSLLGWIIDPSLLPADEFGEEIALEVWMRYTMPNTASSVSVSLDARTIAITGGQIVQTRARYSDEYGAPPGKTLAVPTGGSAPLLARAGVVTIPVDRLRPTRWLLELYFTFAGTGTGNFDLDYAFIVPARSRVASASGKVSDSTYPTFRWSGNANERKRVRWDGTGFSGMGRPETEGRTASMGGSPIELPCGNAQVAALLSGAAVPDDPTPTSGTNDGAVASKSATLHFALTPRYRLLRGA